MARDEAYRKAEEKIEEARRTGATELDLSCKYRANDAEKLTELPESLGQLTQLQTLNLSNNQLTALPESLGQLTQLQTLDLSNNQLTALPESLGQLTQLQTLNLSCNQLTALPEWLGRLTQLQTLNLESNQLTALPESLGQLTQLHTLNLSRNQLTALPESLGQLTQLQTLDLSRNQLTALPESLGQLTQLQTLDLPRNQLTALPESLGQLTQLQTLHLSSNQLTALPESLGHLTQLRSLMFGGNPVHRAPAFIQRLLRLNTLRANECKWTELPEWFGELTQLSDLSLNGSRFADIPPSLAQLQQLNKLVLNAEALNPELAAAYDQGLNAVKAYLSAKAEDQIVLNEAKLILIGEGEVGKTSLLGALRGDEWVENRPTTHGVEVDIKTVVLDVPSEPLGVSRRASDEGDDPQGPAADASRLTSPKQITFNAWDFGGQNIYRHTHQMFFTAPAVYLAVWNPRRGPEQCCVDEWIKMVRLRAFDENRPDERPRILVVATHGGPKERSAHIDEQVLRDEFGDLIAGFHHVDSQPDPETGVCPGLDELKAAIAREAAAIPSVGRSVPTSWKNLLDALQKRSEKDPYISYTQYQAVCRSQSVSDELGSTYAAILNELGYLIHYADDEVLQDTVILKAEYISKAISYVLEDRVAKQQNGLVEHHRLTDIWNDPARPERERYPEGLHHIFLRLMDRFDLSYQVVMPGKDDKPTSLVAQLVPGGRPEGWEQDWRPQTQRGDAERRRVCRLVDAETGFDTTVEGLLYRLIVRLHRYSLGKANYFDSRHWKTGMILDDGINGRALIEEIGGTIQVTVRAAYPDGFLGSLCHEVRSLVDQFWKGLDCRLSVPCHAPCRGLHELEELVETKREGISKVRCSVCKTFHEIDSLLIAAAPQLPMDIVIEELRNVRHDLADMKKAQEDLGSDIKQMIGQANEQFELMMNAMTSLAKDGPRLFSFHPVDPGFWDKPKWISEKFRLTLWCEHARLPLHAVAETPGLGVYEVELSREWVAKAAPVLKVLSKTLSLALPIAAPAVKLAADAATYSAIEDELKFGKECASSFLKAGDNIGEWLNSGEDSDVRAGRVHLADGAELRELHGLLKQLDSNNAFGGLARVQNKRREFLWIHPQFKSEY